MRIINVFQTLKATLPPAFLPPELKKTRKGTQHLPRRTTRQRQPQTVTVHDQPGINYDEQAVIARFAIHSNRNELMVISPRYF